MSTLTISSAASAAASTASATAIHFTTLTSPLEHDEEFGVVHGHVTDIGQHQAPGRDRVHRCRIESRGAFEQAPATVFDQVELPIEVHPAVTNGGETARRLQDAEIGRRRPPIASRTSC